MLTTFDSQSVDLLKKYRQETFIDGKDNYIYLTTILKDVDISDYSKASIVSANQYEEPIDLSRVSLLAGGYDEIKSVDLSDLKDLLQENADKRYEQPIQPLFIDLEDGSRLYFIYINSETSDGVSLRSFSFDGLLLIP